MVPGHLGCTLEVFHVHSYQDQFIQLGPSVFFVYLAYVCILCIHLCFFDLFVSVMFPWAVESSPLQFLALA